MATATEYPMRPETLLGINDAPTSQTTGGATPEDLLEVSDRLMPELIDGQLVEREPMGLKANAVAANVLFFIKGFVRPNDLGLVAGAQGSFQVFPDDPKKVRIPDASFTRWERLPDRIVEEGHGKTAPDLIVEVISKNDRVIDVSEKVRDFLAAGTRLIWVLDPVLRAVQVYRAERPWSLLQASETLEGDDVLPGFRCLVEDLFKI